MEVQNNIAVKFKLFSPKVRYDIFDGKFVLFDNSILYKGINTGVVFTGVAFDFNEKVNFICHSLSGEKLNHYFCNDYICLETTMVGGAIAIATFVPAYAQQHVKEFYAYFIHTGEDI